MVTDPTLSNGRFTEWIRRSPPSPLMDGEEREPSLSNGWESPLFLPEGAGRKGDPPDLLEWKAPDPDPLTKEWRVTVCIHAVNLALWYEGK